jgi:signal transduction histidine kinase
LHESLRLANTDLERRVHERTAELEKALRAKSEFLSRASHELRTPMNHILGFAQLLKLKGLTAKQEASVQHILESGDRLLTLINRILETSESDPADLRFLEASATCSDAPNPAEAKPEKMMIG